MINKIVVYYIPIFLFGFIGLFVSCSSTKIRDNINGGFENYDSSDDEPDGWFTNNLPGTGRYVKLNIDNETVHSGDNSISIAILNSHPQKTAIYNWARRVDKFQTNKTYELKAWIKTYGIKSSPFVEIQFWNKRAEIAKISTIKKYNLTGTKNWRLVNSIFKIPKGTNRVLILVGVSSTQNNGGKVWFDDIQFKRLN